MSVTSALQESNQKNDSLTDASLGPGTMRKLFQEYKAGRNISLCPSHLY